MKHSPPNSASAHGDRAMRGKYQSERIKFRILIPLVLAMGVLLGAFIFAFHQDQRRRAERDIGFSAQHVQQLLAAEQKEKSAVMATTLRAILNDERLAEAF